MTKLKKSTNQKAWLTAALGAAVACGTQAYEVPLSFFGTNLPPVDFHGFASQGFLYSSDYNYLDSDSKNGSFQFSEVGLNASFDPFPHTHITTQGFLFDVGNIGKYQPDLDYGLIDYNFSDALGVRAGRILRPEGIYNTVQSVDLTRTFILLPQGMYDARYRDFSGAVDGGSVYGSLGLAKAGSLSYEVYGGMVTLSDHGGVARYLEDTLNHPPYTSYNGEGDFPEFGLQLWWNTPVSGLRAGLAAIESIDYNFDYSISPLIGGPGDIHSSLDTTGLHPSLEYQWKNWTFQTEYRVNYQTVDNTSGGRPYNAGSGHAANETWYAAAAYRFNKWFEAGTYYTEDYNDLYDTGNSKQYQKDLALSFRFDPTDWWIIKIEGHYLHGTGLLHDNADNPIGGQDDRGWFMLDLKTTVSF